MAASQRVRCGPGGRDWNSQVCALRQCATASHFAAPSKRRQVRRRFSLRARCTSPVWRRARRSLPDGTQRPIRRWSTAVAGDAHEAQPHRAQFVSSNALRQANLRSAGVLTQLVTRITGVRRRDSVSGHVDRRLCAASPECICASAQTVSFLNSWWYGSSFRLVHAGHARTARPTRRSTSSQ